MHTLNTVSILGGTRQLSTVKMKGIPVMDLRNDSQETNLVLS